ncbi:MAG: hypothetical protein U0T84_09235 [Chitinophagales bacterium]
MQTIAHHTCGKIGSKESILKNAPFLAQHSPIENLYQFLGTGYYLWDYNLEFAKRWGDMRYSYGYYIVQFQVNIPDEFFLDLAGNRMDMEWFLGTKKMLMELGYDFEHIMANGKELCIGTYIEFLKRVSKESGANFFPYLAIRAVDVNSASKHFTLKFVENKRNSTNLNPRFVICILDKKALVLPHREIVYESAN